MKKLSLNELKVKSFTTSMDEKTVGGGSGPVCSWGGCNTYGGCVTDFNACDTGAPEICSNFNCTQGLYCTDNCTFIC